MNPKDGRHPMLSYSESIWFCSDSQNLSVTKLLINGKDGGRTNSCFLPSPPLMYKGAQWKSIYNKHGLSVSMGQRKEQSAQARLYHSFIRKSI